MVGRLGLGECQSNPYSPVLSEVVCSSGGSFTHKIVIYKPQDSTSMISMTIHMTMFICCVYKRLMYSHSHEHIHNYREQKETTGTEG